MAMDGFLEFLKLVRAGVGNHMPYAIIVQVFISTQNYTQKIWFMNGVVLSLGADYQK